LSAGQDLEVIDVRTSAEYEAVRLEFARHTPLDQLDPQRIRRERPGANGEYAQPLYVICRGGSRGRQACRMLNASGIPAVNVEGGLQAWEASGLPVHRGDARVLPLERQVRIGAGLLVLLGVVLGALVHPAGYGISAFVGAGLVFAGVTDWCGMALILAKMPWNRAGTRGAGK
jgi:rhodanese-related sulfurtransferase